MRALLADTPEVVLPPELVALLEVKDVDGATFLRSQFTLDHIDPHHAHHDLTGFEASVNKVHLDRFATTMKAMAALAVATIRELAAWLERDRPGVTFQVAASVSAIETTGRPTGSFPVLARTSRRAVVGGGSRGL
ncbi:MAG: hypothetical protein QM831_41430 [Kofleriaceae bacterium]